MSTDRESSMYLSSFAMMEPQESLYIFYPSWGNVWESHMYNKALKSTQAHSWGFKRFGMTKESYAREMIRTPLYKNYIDAMEQVCDTALHRISAKERMLLMKSRTAFIYVDSWGESAIFDDISSALHKAMIDTLPKNLVKKFAINDFTCKIRGEKQSLIQAMKVAQDYLVWDIFDYVVICAAYRAVPILVFSEEDIELNKHDKSKANDIKMNLSVERTGCFIFSKNEGDFQVHCGDYWIEKDELMLTDRANRCADLLANSSEIDLMAFSALRKNRVVRDLLNKTKQSASDIKSISLIDLYGGSGCLSPALSWIYLQQNACFQGKMRTIVPDNFGGYTWFDTQY